MIAKPLTNRFRKKFMFFVDKRNPSGKTQRLHQRNLYIFPSRFGFLFLFSLIILWVLGTNYQNNLVIGLVFLLLSIFLLCILKTYQNLNGLIIEYQKSDQVFAGEVCRLSFKIQNNTKGDREDILLQWQDHDEQEFTAYTRAQAKTATSIDVPLLTQKRGVLAAPRLLVESRFPLGLLRCWTWLRWSAEAVVYPVPVECPQHASTVIDEEGDGGHPVSGGEDFSGLKPYREGDPLKHVAWKALAKEQGMLTKEFSQNITQERWLDFNSVQGNGIEEKLSGLCYWAIQYAADDENYGLKLPNLTIQPNRGNLHQREVLLALGLYGFADTNRQVSMGSST